MAGRASIVGAAETSVGKVRDHNEDAHFIDPEAGIFIVCDGMGGHAAGEVASNLAVKTIRSHWSGNAMEAVADRWLAKGTPEARKSLLGAVTQGVLAAHEAIVSEAAADHGKKGMGTTVVAAIIVGGDVVFAHCGDSRAYLVRDGITVQLTEDHTLLARLLAAGVDVDVDGDGARFKSMLTNALGIGQECKVSCFVVPIADGDRFLLCSDGITEYLAENEIGEVLTTMPSPARSAQRLVEIALQRGGGDNATALVVRILEAGETARPAEQLRKDEQAIHSCALLEKLNPQQRLRALRIALPRDHATGEKVPASTLGDRVSWIIIEGEVEQDGHMRGPGSLLYPEALLADRPLPDKQGLAVARSEVRALALRSDDFRELCDDDPEIGEHLLGAVGTEITKRRPQRRTGKVAVQFEPGSTDPGEIDTQPGNKALEPSDPVAHAATLQRPAIMDPLGEEARGTTLRRPAVTPVDESARAPVDPKALADSLLRPAVLEAARVDTGRANTLRGPAFADGKEDIAHASTLRGPSLAEAKEDISRASALGGPPVVAPASKTDDEFARSGHTQRGHAVSPPADVAAPAVADDPLAPFDDKPRQPRGSTVPPHSVRTRATTDHGTPITERAASEDGRTRRPRPPSEGSRSSLIVPAADTAAAVDEALTDLEGVVADDAPDDAEISVSSEAEPPAAPGNPRSTLHLPSPNNLRPPAPPALRPPAPPRVPAAAAKSGNHSEPEIQIEELVELIADSDDDEEQAVTLSLDDVDDRRANSESEGTITLTIDDTSEGIRVEPLVAADSAPHKKQKLKRPPTGSPE